MAPKNVNAVVIGAGAGGGIVAKELAEAGLTFCFWNGESGTPRLTI